MSTRGAILVTGAGRRLGAAVARRLGRDGWRIIVHCHASVSEAEAVVEELRHHGATAELAQADLRSQADMARLARDLTAAGDWVGLINSAGVFIPDTIADIEAAPALDQLAVNLIAPVFLARMLKQSLGVRQGVVVNISDQKVFNPNPDYLSYTLSKIALTHATDTLAMALAPNVRVNCIAAGLMLPSGDQTEAQFARVHGQTALGRGTRLEDVADAVAYLCGAENVTGAVLQVDAGQHLIASVRDVMFD